MKKIFFFFFGILAVFSAAAAETILQKVFLSTITAPSLDRPIPFRLDIENEFLSGDADPAAATMEIRGVSQPNVENILSVFTPIPSFGFHFSATIGGGNIHFLWMPRKVFSPAEWVFSDPPPNQTLPTPDLSADFWKIVERNETLKLPNISPPACRPDFSTSTSCSFVIKKMVEVTDCGICGQTCSTNSAGITTCACKTCLDCRTVSTGTKTRTCTTIYSCSSWFEGFDDENYKILSSSTVRPASHTGIWEYRFWWQETFSTSNSVSFLFRHFPIAARKTSAMGRLLAFAAGGNPGTSSSGSSGGISFSAPPSNPPSSTPPTPTSPPTPAAGDACAANSCAPPPCAPPPPPRGLNLIARIPVLVDDFEKYEIWYNVENDPDFPYLQNIGVVRDPRISRKIELSDAEIPNRDPATFETEMRNAATDEIFVPLSKIIHFNPATDTAHFAIFEVRRIDFSDKNPPPNNENEKIDTESPENDAGYLLTAKNEIIISPSGISSDPAPQKREIELRNARRRADKNGEFRFENFSFFHLNPFSEKHFIAAVYSSDDTVFSDSSKSFFVGSNRAIGAFRAKKNAFFDFNFEKFSREMTIGGDPAGTVFDAWTKNPVPDAVVKITGKDRVGKLFSATAKTDFDGFFDFLVPSGKYKLSVSQISKKKNVFSFPPNNCATGNFAPFSDLLCDENEIINLSQNPVHRDIPIAPPIFGTAPPEIPIFLQKNGETIGKTFSTPDGKFSFLAPAGNYQLSDGTTVKNISAPMNAPATF